MNKVWIVEELRNYGYSNQSSSILSVNSTLSSAREAVADYEAVKDNNCLYTVTVMRVQN
jgi:hypothetical protein